jgi:hypothetical protein
MAKKKILTKKLILSFIGQNNLGTSFVKKICQNFNITTLVMNPSIFFWANFCHLVNFFGKNSPIFWIHRIGKKKTLIRNSTLYLNPYIDRCLFCFNFEVLSHFVYLLESPWCGNMHIFHFSIFRLMKPKALNLEYFWSLEIN